MDSLGLEPESVDNLDMYSHIPPVLMEKCAALSVRPDTVKNLIQSMQGQWQQQLHTYTRARLMDGPTVIGFGISQSALPYLQNYRTTV